MRAEGELPRRGKRSHPGVSAPTGTLGPRPPVQAPTTARGARSEAERAERGAGQIRPCNPINRRMPPRESTTKPAVYPAAPVGQSLQTRRHHLTPTPVQRGGTAWCPRATKSDFFSSTGRGAFSFCPEQKENGGRICQPSAWRLSASQTVGTPRADTQVRPYGPTGSRPMRDNPLTGSRPAPR